ncbi:ABC transporter ATP-binding protein [Clostridium chauvoei]|uniref:ABC transporter ATP-binding protein n=1 Tax=Clostridium chauvoei TaxID=46867 RepID=UPI001C8430BE|nr:ABC transporter ATP-binding protein [Clostridium chauvoei]MBX7404970.1 ABC transporter ATP-binding protein [Clostridium chauvoei]
MEVIRFENIEKSYEKGNIVIDNLNFTINSGEFVTLLGKSGCGKTTLLKLINGIIKADKGNVVIEGKEINNWDIIELRRNIGYVIQQAGLFPHMTIEDNIGYVLNMKKIPKEEVDKRVRELINIVGIDEEYLKKYPRELSGGQKQRIGVARALAYNPDIILMDEPFGAVDEITRKSLQEEIKKIHRELKKTIIFVTHDIEEALSLGTKVVILDKGKIILQGTAKDMVFNVDNEFVKELFGVKNFSSYLSLTKVSEVVQPLNNDKKLYYEKLYKNKKLPILKEEDSLMEAMRTLFENKLGKALVKNSEDVLIGQFSIRDIYK